MAEPPQELESPDGAPLPVDDADDRTARRRALGWMPVWFLGGGFAAGMFGDDQLVAVIIQVVTTGAFYILTHRWCGADARIHGQTLWRHFVVTLVVCPGPLIVVPIHLIRTRGVRGPLSIVLAIAYFALLIAGEVLGYAVGRWQVT